MPDITKIKLSNKVFEFVKARAEQLGFTSEEDYLIELIRNDQKAHSGK